MTSRTWKVVIISGIGYVIVASLLWSYVHKPRPIDDKANAQASSGLIVSKNGQLIAGTVGVTNPAAVNRFMQDLTKDDELNRCFRMMAKGETLEKEGKYDEAIEEFRKALATKQDDMMNHYSLAEVYEKAGRYPDSIREYNWLVSYQVDALRHYNDKRDFTEVKRREGIISDLETKRNRVVAKFKAAAASIALPPN